MKPFLKWAGGKYRIIDRVKTVLPNGRRLVEPFVGSGAVFLNTDYDNYILADLNADLINLYLYLQKHGKDFIDYIESFFTKENNTQEAFTLLRERFNTSQDVAEKSALFIYLNRHCFNGLCRYNKKGIFNVPFGRYTSPSCPRDEMQFFYEKSQQATFCLASFEETMSQSQLGDVVYCDPPYVPASITSNFSSYTKDGFSQIEQESLGLIAQRLAERGIPVVISNHDTTFTRHIYGKAKIESFNVQRFISSKASDRKVAAELIALFN
jgi:DNA adenine methylase